MLALCRYPPTPKTKQQGVVLFLALIVIVALLLGGVALFRNMDTSLLTIGNISMQRSATRSADSASERAMNWLKENRNGALLYEDQPNDGYIATGLQDVKLESETWADYWTKITDKNRPTPIKLTKDKTDNSSEYLIQRLCLGTGQPQTEASCVKPPSERDTTNPNSLLTRSSGTYYRVLVRTAGPRGVTSYLQSIIVF